MSQKLAETVCMITGASAGIGRASALALAREGASLVLVAQRDVAQQYIGLRAFFIALLFFIG